MFDVGFDYDRSALDPARTVTETLFDWGPHHVADLVLPLEEN